MIVTAAELIEAEGRLLKHASFRFVVAALFVAGAFIFGVLALLALLIALFLGLQTELHDGWAMAICGLVLVIATGVAAWMAARWAR